MPKRLNRDQEPKKEGREGRKSNMLDKTAEKDGRWIGQKWKTKTKEEVKMTVKTKKEKMDKCTEKWCEGKAEREVKAYEWLHYSRREEKLFIYEFI